MAEEMKRLYQKILEQGYKIKAEMEEQGIIDQQIALAEKENRTQREFEYKGISFMVKRTVFGWNLYEIGDVSK